MSDFWKSIKTTSDKVKTWPMWKQRGAEIAQKVDDKPSFIDGWIEKREKSKNKKVSFKQPPLTGSD